MNKEPTTSATHPVAPVKLSPDAMRGEFADLTSEESEHYLKTGELPERVRHWRDSPVTRNAL
jgi:hypothetical protein